MLTEWSLRNELLTITHRWHLPVIAFLLGSLLGWGVSILIPSPYRAEMELYVAYNADAIYRNPDDYKNWQMRQLSDFAVTDTILDETLTRLRSNDPYWQSVSSADFRSMVKVLWRNAGKWHLVVENHQPQRSAQVIQTWSEVIISEYDQARKGAIEQSALDKQLWLVTDSLVDAQLLKVDLTEVNQALQILRETIDKLPADQPVDNLTRWKIWSMVAKAAKFDPAWQTLLNEFPLPETIPAGYAPWLDNTLTLLEEQLKATSLRIEKLESEQSYLTTDLENAIKTNRGLSANLEVGREYYTPIEAEIVRPTGLAALIGGAIGLLVWSIFWIARPIYQTKR